MPRAVIIHSSIPATLASGARAREIAQAHLAPEAIYIARTAAAPASPRIERTYVSSLSLSLHVYIYTRVLVNSLCAHRVYVHAAPLSLREG